MRVRQWVTINSKLSLCVTLNGSTIVLFCSITTIVQIGCTKDILKKKHQLSMNGGNGDKIPSIISVISQQSNVITQVIGSISSV